MTRRVLLAALWAAALGASDFHFVILGDRMGEVQPGVWERVLSQAAATKPAFMVTVGDTIQGLDDATAAAQWRDAELTLAPYRKIPLYLAAGNHDVWSVKSEELYRQHSGHPLHYSFDYGGAHFTVLDNSRSDALPESEIAFLESDLAAHADASVKFAIMHRPSWIMGGAGLQRIAKRYGVRYWITGHVHQLMHAEIDGVTYYCAPSAGGHLRLSGKYEDGWFFGWTRVDVKDGEVTFEVHDVDSHVTSIKDWGLAGLRR